MRGIRTASLLSAATLFLLAVSPAQAETCSGHRATCESVCTPDRVARYYAGSEARCTSSCYPRWSQCMRTGWWADLERRYSGGWQPAARFFE